MSVMGHRSTASARPDRVRSLTEDQIASALHASLRGQPLDAHTKSVIYQFSKRLGYTTDAEHLAFARRCVATPRD